MVSLETAYLTPSMHSILKSNNNNKALYPGNVNPILRQACKTQVFICFNKQLKVQAAQRFRLLKAHHIHGSQKHTLSVQLRRNLAKPSVILHSELQKTFEDELNCMEGLNSIDSTLLIRYSSPKCLLVYFHKSLINKNIIIIVNITLIVHTRQA